MTKKRSVLIADDDPSMRSMLELMLEKQFAIDTASTIDDIQTRLNNTRYDIVLLDIHFSGKTTLELYKNFVKNRTSHNPFVIVVSVDTKSEIIRELYETGAFYYISKPFKAELFGNFFQHLLLDIDLAQKAQLNDTRPFNLSSESISTIADQIKKCESSDAIAKVVTARLADINLNAMLTINHCETELCFDSRYGKCSNIEFSIVETMKQCALPLHLQHRSLFVKRDVALLIKTMPSKADPCFDSLCESLNSLVNTIDETLHRI